jgi:hypothetical protein
MASGAVKLFMMRPPKPGWAAGPVDCDAVG